MPSSSVSNEIASSWTASYCLPRWLCSMTDMPEPLKSSNSSFARSSAGRGSPAGPGLKLMTRMTGPLFGKNDRAEDCAERLPRGKHEAVRTRENRAARAYPRAMVRKWRYAAGHVEEDMVTWTPDGNGHAVRLYLRRRRPDPRDAR